MKTNNNVRAELTAKLCAVIGNTVNTFEGYGIDILLEHLLKNGIEVCVQALPTRRYRGEILGPSIIISAWKTDNIEPCGYEEGRDFNEVITNVGLQALGLHEMKKPKVLSVRTNDEEDFLTTW